ncbi:MAG TPA: translation initiation factor IF-2 associated domain-containing protein, partial [Arenibaculum sp.]|nr:translation initiation factor IF-2 associated domain-containing protein [Arenibaculum sp.]
MTDSNDQDRKKVLSLGGRGKMELKKTVDAGSVRQSFSHGRSKTVTVEVKRKRTLEKGAVPGIADGGAAARRAAEGLTAKQGAGRGSQRGAPPVRQLTREERDARMRALQGAIRSEEERRQIEEELAAGQTVMEPEPVELEPEPEPVLDADTLRAREMEELRSIQEAERQVAEAAESRRQEEEARRKEAEAARRKPEEDARKAEEERRRPAAAAAPRTAEAPAARPAPAGKRDEEEDDPRRRKSGGRAAPAQPAAAP